MRDESDSFTAQEKKKRKKTVHGALKEVFTLKKSWKWSEPRIDRNVKEMDYKNDTFPVESLFCDIK